jgi:hypothetical protein
VHHQRSMVAPPGWRRHQRLPVSHLPTGRSAKAQRTETMDRHIEKVSAAFR